MKIQFPQVIRRVGLVVAIILNLVGCTSPEQRQNYYKEANENRPPVDEKYRLSADRKKLEEMRAEIPQDMKQQNDEVAFSMQLMSELKYSPSDVRGKFDAALRKKRDLFQKDMQKERDLFNKTEQKSREQFLKALDSERKDFLRFKKTKEERDDFFGQQDEKRKNYFETHKEKRNDFEADVTERRKNFEDYAREKTNEFNQDWRAYQKRYDENEKQKKLEKENKAKALSQPQSQKIIDAGNADEVKSFLEELDQIHGKPGTQLEVGQ